MSSPRTRKDPPGPVQLDALPLRSLAVVWIGASVLGLGLLAFASRGAFSGGASRPSAPAVTTSQGPTKRQVRERQEHIALTERALELARKERKTSADPGAASGASAGTPGSAPSAAAASAAPVPPAGGAGAKPGPRVREESDPAEAAEKAPAAPAAAAPSKPASSGLDEMRADIAAALE